MAEINDQAISEAEFALYVQSLPSEHREAISQNPDERRKAFEAYLRMRLYALAAQESGHPALDSLHRRLATLDQMIIAQYYQLVFIGQNLGHTRKEMEAFYSRHPEKFRDSSGHIPPVHDILERVSDTMALARADLDSFYRANAANYPPPQPALQRKLAENYLLEMKQTRSENSAAELVPKYGARIFPTFSPPTDADIAAYYAQNKEAYRSPDAFDLYHIETSTPKSLRSQLSAAKDLEGFKSLAGRVSENTWTKPLGGRLGPVKRDFCLPYGIGLLPALFQVLDTTQPGIISEPLQNPETGKWHYFWLAEKVPGAIKPLDRVRTLVRQDLLNNRLPNPQPTDTVAVVPGRRAILERDVGFLRDEYPDQFRDQQTRANLVEHLVEREVIVAEAETLGLLQDDRLKAKRLDNEFSFWSRFYEEKILPPSWNEDTASLAALFASKPQVFTRDPKQQDWRPFARDLAAYSLLSPQELKTELHINRERYLRGDSLPPVAEVESEVFHSLKSEAYRRLDAKVASALRSRFHVHVAPSLQEPTYEPADEFLKQAEQLHRDQNPEQALFLYGKLQERFLERGALQHSVGLGIAKIHLEQQRYQQALAEYRRVSLLYPENPDNDKAMFMEGFIQAEYFKRDSAAVRVFESMLKKYPGSKLSEEAGWMIRNIRSGGTPTPAPESGG